MSYGDNPARDGIAQELMAQNNPSPGYLSPPQMPPPPTGLDTTLGQPPPGPSGGLMSMTQGMLGAPPQPSMPLPGGMTPGQLPQGMVPAPPQPSMPMPGAVQPPQY